MTWPDNRDRLTLVTVTGVRPNDFGAMAVDEHIDIANEKITSASTVPLLSRSCNLPTFRPKTPCKRCTTFFAPLVVGRPSLLLVGRSLVMGQKAVIN